MRCCMNELVAPTSPIMPLGRSCSAADATREVAERLLLDGLDVSVGHRRCPRDPSTKNDAGGTPAPYLCSKYHTPLHPHSGRFCSTIPLFSRSLRSSTHSRISSRAVSEAQVFAEFRGAVPGGSALFLHQDASQSLEHCRNSLSEKDPSAPNDS